MVLEAAEQNFRELPLSNGGFCIVSNEDFEWLNKYKWHKRSDDGYAARREKLENGKATSVRMHREILKPGKGIIIDHVNHNRLDNRRENLRIASRSQNGANSSISSRNKSGYKGVHFSKDKNKWRADIRVNRKGICLGYYDTVENAAHAYNEAATKYFGEFAFLNEIAGRKRVE